MGYTTFQNNKYKVKNLCTSELNNDGGYTVMGNTFNGVDQLVQLDSNGKIDISLVPAYGNIDGGDASSIYNTVTGIDGGDASGN